MRHHDRKTKLGREKNQRLALMRSLLRSLILREGITTTAAKAKALRPHVERMITASKNPSLATNRTLTSALGGAKDTNKKLHELAKRYEKRTGGYTRIVRMGRVGKRVGEMARIEFVQ